jgi:molybdate transport system substrate-binding protein
MLRSLLALVGLSVLVSCGMNTGAESATSCDLRGSITVLAAASLSESFTDLRQAFLTAHPCAEVTLSFAGSQRLVAQLAQGGPGDVLATADTTSMRAAQDQGQVGGQPRTFARNTLAIAVIPGNPRKIRGLADLARSGLKVVLAAPEVPAGALTAKALVAAHVQVNPASLEQDVRGVLSKVRLGEADAGIVYSTDVRAAGSSVEGVEIPASENQATTYPIAVTSAGTRSPVATAFVDLVVSRAGVDILAGRGFLPP